MSAILNNWKLFLLCAVALFASGCVLDDDDGNFGAVFNEVPDITSDGGGDTASLFAAENQTSVTTVTYTDADEPADSITFGFGGGSDDELFSISSGGVLVFKEAPNFTRPGDSDGDGTYEVVVEINDGNGGIDAQTISVAVTATPLATVLRTMQSGGVEREYYLQLPTDYDDGTGVQAAALGDDMRKPLLFAYHGYTGSYQNWVGDNRFYDLVDVVGDDAIIIVPNGLPNASDQRVWGGQKDLDFFVDMLAELDMRGLQYNPNMIFVAGHSNGAGFAHELGCAYGDVIRGIATAAGALTNNDCVGSTAVLMMQGSNDPLTVGSLAQGALNYWVLYNGWDKDAFVPATVGPCDDYSFPGKLNSDYPVLWCEHLQGHDWPDFGSQTVWDFLTGLAEVEPTPDAPFGGGSARATPQPDAFLTFQIDVPADMNRPVRGVATLRPLSWVESPTCSAPDIVLGVFAVDGKLVPGQVSEPITIPVTYLDFSGTLQFPSDQFALSLTVYVEGGSTGAIPTPGVDHDAAAPISLVAKNLDVEMSEVLTLAPIPNLCGF